MYHTINTAQYKLQKLPWQPNHFQQYSAQAHHARVTVEYLRQLGHPKIHIARSLAT